MEDFGTVVKYSSRISCSTLIISLLEVCTSLGGGWLVLLWYPFHNLVLCVLHVKGRVVFSFVFLASALPDGDHPLENSILKQD